MVHEQIIMIDTPTIIYLINCIFYVVFALILWFEGDVTDFISRATFSTKLFKRKEFKEFNESELLGLTYPEFLAEKYPGFLTKLLSCPICLCFWLTLIFSIFLFGTNFFLILPFSYYISLTLYLIIKKLLK